jgi:hypothetical protein
MITVIILIVFYNNQILKNIQFLHKDKHSILVSIFTWRKRTSEQSNNSITSYSFTPKEEEEH